MKAYGKSHQGLVRANNEDSYYIDQGGLLIVADGMGGHAGGEEASSLAVETVVKSLGSEDKTQPVQAIRNAFLAANRVVLSTAASDPSLKGMGTTLTLAMVRPDFLITGHIGDSKAFLLDNAGIRCLTGDHSVSGQLLASGKISNSEAQRHPQRHVLTRAMGTGADIDIEILTFPWSPGQQLLLCSDGLTEVLSAQEILGAAGGKDSLEQKVNSLLTLVLERGAPDNVTIILAQL